MSDQPINEEKDENKIVDIGKLSDLEAFDFLINVLGFAEIEARFMIGISNGDLPGDIIIPEE